MSWLVDNANLWYVLFGMAALGTGAAWWLRRETKYLVGVTIAVGVILLLWLLTRLVVTDRQQLELNISQLDLVALVQQVATALQATTTRHRIRVEAAVPHVLIAGDALRLDRVIANLLSNAIKYSPRGGTITIKVSREEREDKTRDFAVVEVADQGLGIPAAYLPHIFDRFRRAANVTGRILGTGIGLANCLQIVRQHDGTISVTSLEGSGTTFFVRLPL